jgi:hypothetical protein
MAGAPIAPARKLGSPSFRLGGGLHRHSALSLIFRSRKGDPTHSFSTSSRRVFVRVSLFALLLLRRSCRFTPWFLVSLLHSLPVPYERGFRVVQGGTVGQLFDGEGKVLWGFIIVLGPRFPLTAESYGQFLVPKSVLSCSVSLSHSLL